MTTPPIDPDWWMKWTLALPIIGIYIKLHFAQNKKIADALLAAVEADKNAARSHEALASCRLGVEQEFAKNGYLSDLETRLTSRIEKMETNIMDILKNKHKG